VKLKTLTVSDFMSFGAAEIDFEKLQNLTVIEGINRDSNPVCSNGTGKSTIVEAVTFALFGRTIRKTRETSIIRHGAKSCVVDLSVDMEGHNVFIQRSRRPSKLFVSINGKDVTKESAVETQKFLLGFLNIDFTTYLAAVMFGQNNNNEFVSSTPAEKRKILQSFLGIEDYFEIREVVRVKKKDHKNNIASLQGEKKAGLKHIEAVKLQQDKIKEANQSSEIKNAETKLEDLQIYKEELHKHKLAVEVCTKLKKKILSLEDKINSIRKTKSCPTCKQDLPNDDLEKNYSLELEDLRDELSNSDLTPPIKPEFEETEEEIQKYLALKEYRGEESSFDSIIEETESNLREVEESITLEQRDLILSEYWEQAFSEQGLVKYIIRNIIDFFNAQVGYYLSLITNGHLTITFTQSLEETVFSGKSLVEYNALSGGERKKINIAVMLGLHDLLKFNKKSTPDFIVFDEITEVDKSGIRNISSLIETIAKKHNKKIFMITHNSDLMAELDNYNKITVQKRNGKSKIKSIKYAK
jgi:DNA repair exonuclease SbcCD ATPase subunit